MENNKKDRIITITLFLIIVLLFSVLFYYCLEVFEVIDTKNNLSVASIMEETVKTVSNTTNQIKEIMIDTPPEENKIEKSEEAKKLEDKIFQDLNDKSNEQSEIYKLNESNKINYNEQIKVDYKRFYYNQINDNAKIIYDKILENKDNLKSGTYKIELGDAFDSILKEKDGTVILKEAYTQAVRSILFDYPEIFFLEVSKLCIVTETKTSMFSKEYNVNIMPEEGESYLNSQFSTEAIVSSASNEMEKIAEEIKNETEGYSNIDKVKYVHDYLVENIEYDSTVSKPNIHNIYGALVTKKAVCEGYAKAFKYILDRLDVPSIIVVGYSLANEELESHSWNYVNIDGKWYGVDTTFDDPIVLGGPVINNNIRYKYYLKGGLEFSEVHKEDPMSILEFDIKYPTLEEENF